MERRSAILVVLGFTLACSDSPVDISGEHSPGIQLIAEAERNLPERPQGIAVTPDGRFAIVGSYVARQVFLLDLENLHTIDSTPAPDPWGVTMDPGGGRAWVGAKFGSVVLGVPDFEALLQFPFRTRTFVRGAVPNTLYAAASDRGEILRIDVVTDEIMASRPLPIDDTSCLALVNRDEALLTVDISGLLYVLDPVDLSIRRTIEVPYGCWTVVPLDEDGAALVLGVSEDSMGQFPAASIIDWRTGESRTADVPRPTGEMRFAEYGYGNPWVRVDDLIFAPGRQGILVADARSGEVLQLIEGTPSTEGTNYCCEIAWDPTRRRLLVVGDYLVRGHLIGRLVTYRIER